MLNFRNIILIGFLFILSFNAESQNLILNPSFEQNGQADCTGWYPVCDAPFHVTCDSTFGCGVMIIKESTPDSLGGAWCLQTYGNFPFPGAVITYITGRTGTFIYQLKFWMKSEHFISEVYLGVIKDQVFTEPSFFTNYTQPWTLYTIRDTITTSVSDTIGVQLGSAIGDFCICDVEYDQVELTVIDSLSTGIAAQLNKTKYEIYPNPFKDILTVSAPGSNGFILAVFDLNGKQIKSGKSSTDIINLDMTSIPQGIYYFRLNPINNVMLPCHGKIIKQ